MPTAQGKRTREGRMLYSRGRAATGCSDAWLLGCSDGVDTADRIEEASDAQVVAACSPETERFVGEQAYQETWAVVADVLIEHGDRVPLAYIEKLSKRPDNDALRIRLQLCDLAAHIEHSNRSGPINHCDAAASAASQTRPSIRAVMITSKVRRTDFP